MVVDDEAPTLDLLKDILSNEGYDVTVAKNGEECIQFLNKGKIPKLIILDIMMPVLNGWDTAAKIKTNNAFIKIPIIFLTAKSDRTSKELGKFTSAFYVEKPFEISDLLAKVEETLKNVK